MPSHLLCMMKLALILWLTPALLVILLTRRSLSTSRNAIWEKIAVASIFIMPMCGVLVFAASFIPTRFRG